MAYGKTLVLRELTKTPSPHIKVWEPKQWSERTGGHTVPGEPYSWPKGMYPKSRRERRKNARENPNESPYNSLDH